MDDFNTSVLSEAKNEYSSRLINILTPLIIQGFKSIFKEAYDLCIKNGEEEKYLMTFQNFLTRVPRWNQEIINVETNRIVDTSKCIYLEDLLTCVHITQLKILTSIRVSNKQKKIDIDIPKLHDYIHKIYIAAARKLYGNVYLFEENIMPLDKQKNMRECEVIVKESILNVIRESMPIEKILRAYIDETQEEEVVEEEVVEEEVVEEKERIPVENNEVVVQDAKKVNDISTTIIKQDIPKEIDKSVVSPIITATSDENTNENTKIDLGEGGGTGKQQGDTATSLRAPLITPPPSPTSPLSSLAEPSSPSSISFNDNDNIVKYSTTDNPRDITKKAPEIISAPKTIERLEKISTERNEQRKREEREEDEDFTDSIKIFSNAPNIKLDALDIQDISKGISLKNKPELSGVEVLA